MPSREEIDPIKSDSQLCDAAGNPMLLTPEQDATLCDLAHDLATEVSKSIDCDSYLFKRHNFKLAARVQIGHTFIALLAAALREERERVKRVKRLEMAMARIIDASSALRHDDRQQEIICYWPKDDPQAIARAALADVAEHRDAIRAAAAEGEGEGESEDARH
jgi:hypothetical protein